MAIANRKFGEANVLSDESKRGVEEKNNMDYFVYIIRFSDNNLYIGQTNNLQERLKNHSAKSTKSAKFVKDHEKFVLFYQEKYSSRLESMRREKQLKGWTRAKKEALIVGDKNLLKIL